MGKIRSFINKKFVESNQSLVEAMLYINEKKGRSDNIVMRTCRVLRLYFKYVILRATITAEKQKEMNRAMYPESHLNQKEELKKIACMLRKSNCVTFDMWGVLFYEALDMQQLLALAEVGEHYIGFSDIPVPKKALSTDQIKYAENVIMDFAVENPVMGSLLCKAMRKGKSVYIYNNSDYPDKLVQKILDRHSYNARLGKKGLHIVNDKKNRKDMEYHNVNIMGDVYRPFCYLNAVTALYNQVVNIQFHGQGIAYPLFYEYGFAYGGILTCGFCQFLGQIAAQEKIDRFLFVARDGYIMKKVYDKYFHDVDTSYLVFSRFASYELIFADFPEEYIDKNIKPRMECVGTDNSIKKILQECGMEFLEGCLAEERLLASEALTKENYEKLRMIILRHQSEVQKSFAETCQAAEEYIMGEIGTSKKVCVVDLGWHGKSIVYLKHLCEKKYGWSGTIVGAMIGASPNSVVQNYIRTGLLHIYAFKNEYWRNMGAKVGKFMGYKECICLEALFSSESETLLRYTYDEKGNVAFIYGKENKNKDNVAQIHRGILDFSERFMPLIQKYHLQITERDAYTPVDAVMQNRKYQDRIYQSYHEETNALNGF